MRVMETITIKKDEYDILMDMQTMTKGSKMEKITIKKDDFIKLTYFSTKYGELWEERDELEAEIATLKRENRKLKDMMKRVEVEVEILKNGTM